MSNWSINKVHIFIDRPFLFQLTRKVWRYKSDDRKTVNQRTTGKTQSKTKNHIGQNRKGQNHNQRSRIHYTENQNNEQHELNRKHGVNSGVTFVIITFRNRLLSVTFN
jgi:hypothetical protein